MMSSSFLADFSGISCRRFRFEPDLMVAKATELALNFGVRNLRVSGNRPSGMS